MIRPDIKNRHLGSRGIFTPVIDHDNFMGRTAHDPRWSRSMVVLNESYDEASYTIDIAIPGFAKDEILVTVEDDNLVVVATKEENQEVESTKEYIMKEFDTDTVERRFTLAPGISHDKISASFKNGILTINFYDLCDLHQHLERIIPVE